MHKTYRVTVTVGTLPSYSNVVRAKSHAAAAAAVPNPMGGKIKTVLLKGGPST